MIPDGVNVALLRSVIGLEAEALENAKARNGVGLNFASDWLGW